MTSMSPIIQIREHGEILAVLLNVLQGLAADVVRAGGSLGKNAGG